MHDIGDDLVQSSRPLATPDDQDTQRPLVCIQSLLRIRHRANPIAYRVTGVQGLRKAREHARESGQDPARKHGQDPVSESRDRILLVDHQGTA